MAKCHGSLQLYSARRSLLYRDACPETYYTYFFGM